MYEKNKIKIAQKPTLFCSIASNLQAVATWTPHVEVYQAVHECKNMEKFVFLKLLSFSTKKSLIKILNSSHTLKGLIFNLSNKLLSFFMYFLSFAYFKKAVKLY